MPWVRRDTTGAYGKVLMDYKPKHPPITGEWVEVDIIPASARPKIELPPHKFELGQRVQFKLGRSTGKITAIRWDPTIVLHYEIKLDDQDVKVMGLEWELIALSWFATIVYPTPNRRLGSDVDYPLEGPIWR